MAIHNTYDHALKVLARTYPDHFLALTLPNQPVKLVGTQENVELALELSRSASKQSGFFAQNYD